MLDVEVLLLDDAAGVEAYSSQDLGATGVEAGVAGEQETRAASGAAAFGVMEVSAEGDAAGGTCPT